jgi:hypothetical protein
MVIEPFVRIVPDDDHAILERIDILDGSSLFVGVKFPIVLMDDIFQLITRLHG